MFEQTGSWKRLEAGLPTELAAARTELRYVAQSVSVEGRRSVEVELQLSRFAHDQFVDELLLAGLTAGDADRGIADIVGRCFGHSDLYSLKPIQCDLPPR